MAQSMASLCGSIFWELMGLQSKESHLVSLLSFPPKAESEA